MPTSSPPWAPCAIMRTATTDRLPHQRALPASHRRHAHRGASVPHLPRKAEHARRVVPVHGSARPILQQRVARSSDGWVCSGLTPAGPDGKRSWIVVKRFATFCQKVLGPSKQVDVHSFRRCFATYLQRASTHTTTVNSSVIAELMGHAKPRSALPYTRQDSDRSNSEPPSRFRSGDRTTGDQASYSQTVSLRVRSSSAMGVTR